MATRRMLRDIDHRSAVFTTYRKPLQHAQGDENDRRCDADRRKTRQQDDGERCEAHQEDGDHEGVLATDQIAEAPENDGTERSDGKACSKTEQGKDECCGGIYAREKMSADLRRQSANKEEVVPLEHSAQGGCEHNELVALRHGDFRQLLGSLQDWSLLDHVLSRRARDLPMPKALDMPPGTRSEE